MHPLAVGHPPRSTEVGNAESVQQTSEFFLTLPPTLPGQNNCVRVLTQKYVERYTKNVHLLIHNVSHGWLSGPVFQEDK